MKICDNCGIELKPVSDIPMRRREDITAQYWDALGIQFIKGYGMFEDDISSLVSTPKFLVICHRCAHGLLNAHPWMKKMIDDHPTDNCIDNCIEG
jgi:hypothetical protein